MPATPEKPKRSKPKSRAGRRKWKKRRQRVLAAQAETGSTPGARSETGQSALASPHAGNGSVEVPAAESSLGDTANKTTPANDRIGSAGQRPRKPASIVSSALVCPMCHNLGMYLVSETKFGPKLVRYCDCSYGTEALGLMAALFSMGGRRWT